MESGAMGCHFIASQHQTRSSLPGSVTLQLDPVNISPLQAGLMLGFIGRGSWRGNAIHSKREGLLILVPGLVMVLWPGCQQMHVQVSCTRPAALWPTRLAASFQTIRQDGLTCTPWRLHVPCGSCTLSP